MRPSGKGIPVDTVSRSKEKEHHQGTKTTKKNKMQLLQFLVSWCLGVLVVKSFTPFVLNASWYERARADMELRLWAP
jgi:predicted outer membrane lipoprotein